MEADDAITTEAVNLLAEYAAGPGGKKALLNLMGKGVARFRWHDLANAILKNDLKKVVPDNSRHQTPARDCLGNAMAHDGWPPGESHSPATRLQNAEKSVENVMEVVGQIRKHYNDDKLKHPFPSYSGIRDVPLPFPSTLDPFLRAAMSGQTPPGKKLGGRRGLDGAQDRRSVPGTSPTILDR